MINNTDKCYSAETIVPIMKEIIKSGRECRLNVTGNSMSPTLKHKRDSVILVSPEKRYVKKGEIVFIQRDSCEYILHRVYKTYNDYFVMNGDNQQWCENVDYRQVIGVAKKIVRNNREISCDNRIYKLYVFIWMFLKNYRRQIYKEYSLIKKR